MEHAEKARESGLRVFPLYKIIDGKCECGDESCKVAGKHPRAANWQHTPDWSDEQFDFALSVGQYETGYGVLCRGLLVIDVDARNGGVESYARLLDECPGISESIAYVVETGSGSGSKHVYFRLEKTEPLKSGLDMYKGIDFKSSGFVVGAGSLHASGNRYTPIFGDIESIEPAPSALLEALKKPQYIRAEIDGQYRDIGDSDIADMLAVLDPDMDHNEWVRVGMAVHHATSGSTSGLALWDEWSSRGAKYSDAGETAYKWHSFGKGANPVTVGTLWYMATQAGWSQSMEFDYTSGDSLAPVEPVTHGGLPDTSGIDLRRPPGLVGQIAEQINDMCMYPRENLATAAALITVGNIIGMSYYDPDYRVTPNLFAFCTAGSGTGKDSIIKAMQAIHREVGIAQAMHGDIKSHKEMITNLIEHQAAFYCVDEVGDILSKIKNAERTGGAVYLEGIMGFMMQVYGRANDTLLVTGDRKREMIASLKAEIARINSLMDKEGESEKLVKMKARIDERIHSALGGIERPFMSLIGFTVPTTFNDFVNEATLMNGFMRRSLLFQEHNSAPRRKRGFRPRKIDDMLITSLRMMYHGGAWVADGIDRVEEAQSRVAITTTSDAKVALEAIADDFEEASSREQDTTGAIAIYRGGFEMVLKVSMILAAEHRVRTFEHVAWAYAIVMRDTQVKRDMAVSTMTANPGDALMIKLRSKLDEDWQTIGQIANKVRKTPKVQVTEALDLLAKKGQVEKSVEKHAVNGEEVLRFRLVK